MFEDRADLVNVRYMVDDVDAAIDFYTQHLGFTLRMSAAPAFADVVRGQLRLLLGGPNSSAGRAMPDGTHPAPGGWNRIHLIVSDIAGEVAGLRATGLRFRNEIVSGPGGQQILLEDPSGNVVELLQPPTDETRHGDREPVEMTDGADRRTTSEAQADGEVNQWWLVVAVGLAVFMASVDMSIVNVAPLDFGGLGRRLFATTGGVA